MSDATVEGQALHDALDATTMTYQKKKSTAVLVSMSRIE
jgi:hypothetical protein